MRELTKNESRAIIGAINTTINMIEDLMSETYEIKEAISTLEEAKGKIIESIYKVGE